MFTGIVQEIIVVKRHWQVAAGDQITLSRPHGKIHRGESVLVHGICSTITALTRTTIAVQYMPETIRRTTIKYWTPLQRVHCELPVTPLTLLSGGLVTGHCDGVGRVSAIHRQAGQTQLDVRLPPALQHYVVDKGSITLDGVQLTVAQVLPHGCRVYVIPYTVSHTTFAELQRGQPINLECDYFAKLAWRWRQHSR